MAPVPAPGSIPVPASAPRRPSAATLRALLALCTLWAVYITAVQFIADTTVHDPGMAVSPNFRNELHGYTPSPAGAPALARWDSVWYQSIASEGYPAPHGLGVYNVAFLPLYGLLMRSVAAVCHLGVLDAGVWVSRVALLGTMALLWFQARSRSTAAQDAWAPVAALLAFPSAFLLTSVYAEATFLLFALAAWVLADRRRWVLAFAVAFAAGITRMHALALLPGLFVHGLATWWPERRRPAALAAFLPAAGVAAGLGALAGYFQHVAHDPLLYFHRKVFFGSVTGGPAAAWTSSVRNFREALDRHTFGALYTLLEIPCALLLLGSAGVLLARRRYGEAVYVLCTVGLSAAAGSLWGIPRYSLFVFPVFLLAIRPSRRPALWTGYLVVSALLQTCLLVNYVNLRPPAP